MAAGASSIPPSLKTIQPYLKIAKEYEKRNPVVAYYCRLHAVQKGIKTDSKSKEGKTFLLQLMDQLEKTKKELASEDAITSDVVGQAFMDERASQLFLWADTEDRAARFNKNVIKSFYTASLLYDTLIQFGELSDEAIQRQKYSKWKATYINKCLKEGTTPIPGPPGDDDLEFNNEFGEASSSQPPPSQPPSDGGGYPSYNTGQPYSYNQPPSEPPSYNQPAAPPQHPSSSSYNPEPEPSPGSAPGPSLQEFDKAQKFCKYAISAMQYEDAKAAMENLEKAMAILKPH